MVCTGWPSIRTSRLTRRSPGRGKRYSSRGDEYFNSDAVADSDRSPASSRPHASSNPRVVLFMAVPPGEAETIVAGRPTFLRSNCRAFSLVLAQEVIGILLRRELAAAHL